MKLGLDMKVKERLCMRRGSRGNPREEKGAKGKGYRS